MAMKSVSGHQLEIGDRVKMNIDAIEKEGDLDGVEITATGKNYWKYMNEHPDEVYTVTAFDFSDENEVSYVLSGFMGDNNWFANELIHLPEPKSRFEAIKNMTIEEMSTELFPLLHEICEDGIPSPELFRSFLEGAPGVKMEGTE